MFKKYLFHICASALLICLAQIISAQDQVCGDFPPSTPFSFAQAHSKMIITDRFGNRYTQQDISIGSLDAYNRLPNGLVADCSAGLFDVYFDDLRPSSTSTPLIGFLLALLIRC